jgi:hypothetical protein
MLTTPEQFAAGMFCSSRRYCNRCRNDRAIRVAILKNHGIEHDGKGCPLGLPWDTKPENLPTEARWECPNTPENAVWARDVKPALDQLAKDIAFEQKHGRAALLDMKVNEGRAQAHEIEESQRLAGIEPNSCRLCERTTCGCSGGGWVVCHFPGFATAEVPPKDFRFRPVNVPANARGDVPADMLARLKTHADVERARFRAALDAACRQHGNCLPEHREACDKCWQAGAKGTRA